MADTKKKLTEMVTAVQISIPKALTEQEEKEQQEQQKKGNQQTTQKKAGT